MRRLLSLLLLVACASSAQQVRQYPSSEVSRPRVGVRPAPPPAPIAVVCPCYSAASIQAVFDTCGTILSTTCNAPALTLAAFCSGPPVTNLGSWIQVADANECSRLYQDPETGNPATETLPVTVGQRAACTAILAPLCPS